MTLRRAFFSCGEAEAAARLLLGVDDDMTSWYGCVYRIMHQLICPPPKEPRGTPPGRHGKGTGSIGHVRLVRIRSPSSHPTRSTPTTSAITLINTLMQSK